MAVPRAAGISSAIDRTAVRTVLDHGFGSGGPTSSASLGSALSISARWAAGGPGVPRPALPPGLAEPRFPHRIAAGQAHRQPRDRPADVIDRAKLAGALQRVTHRRHPGGRAERIG